MPSALLLLETNPSIGPFQPSGGHEFVEITKNNNNAKKHRDVKRA